MQTSHLRLLSSVSLWIFVCFGLGLNSLSAQASVVDLEEATQSSQFINAKIGEKTFTARKILSKDLGQDNFSWSGKLSNGETGFLSFARIGDHFNGSLTLHGGNGFSIKGKKGNLLIQSGFAHAKACGGCKFEEGQLPADPRKAAQPLKSWRNGDANLIDLLVVYPSAVRSAAGSTAAVEAAIASAVADSNLCYRSSLVPMQLRVVHMAEVTYTPTGLLDTDLSRLKNPSDGSMDNVHTLRDQYGADLVCMLTTTSDAGGLASTMQHPSHNFESSGFNVNVWDQLGAPSYTLAHEIGHNMGCLHNREDSTWDSDYELSAFCFGKRWYQGGQGYRTVMSYDSNPASYGNRIPFFSNPNVSYLGTSVGNAGTEDNAQVLSITAPYVSNFRTSKVQAILPTVFDRVVPEGNTTSFKVRLTVQPVGSVNVSLSVSGDSDFFLSGSSSLTFDSTNWNIAQTVQVSAQADTDSANGTGTLTLSATGIPSATVQLSELDSGTSLESNFLVSGIVRNDLGMGLSGVTLAFSNGGPTLNSDANGSFRSLLNSGWAGTVTPSKAGYIFTPSVLTIGSLGANSTGHVFEANSSNILYVDKDATGVEDGTSWANAYVDLAQALLSQQSFNEVWVAEGTYLPGTIKSTSFILPPNVQVYGGFAGNETARTQRNAVTHPTILSGDIGTQANSSDNSYHVVVPSQGSTLDGFTIKDGNASKNFSNDDRGIGAGLYADDATFVISDCIFMDNRSRQRGGAVYLKDCNATFVDCNFTNNKGTAWGNGLGYAGAIYASGGRLILQSTSFIGNSADLEGGAIFAENTDLNSTNCVFSGNQNTANNGGGAIRVAGGSFHDSNGTFTSNTSASSGGAIYVSSVSGSVHNSSFSSNQAAFSGGAIRALDSNFTSNHSVFSLNAATGSGGGAIDLENGSFHDANGSYSNNSAGLGGGAMRWTNTTGSIQDSNFTENQNPTSNGGGAISLSNASPGFSKCRFLRNGTLANNHGGAVKMLSSSSSFTNCVFTRNYSQVNSGGAIYADGSSSPTFTNNEFRFNHSVQFGGAIFAESNLNFSGGLFLGNYANFGGGVATQGSVSCSFSNIRILGNEANSSGSSSGGFAYFNTGSTGSTFVNCVISGNKSLGRNGVYRPTGTTRFVNCSIVGNQSAAEGGIALLFAGDSLALDNSIMWGNTATTGNEIYVNTGTASANYSLFNAAQSIGSISGSNNLNSDPLFSDANGADNVYGTEDDDLSLQSSSPALDNASSSVANYSTTDLLGRSRSGNPDRGAYEFIPAAPPVFTSSSSYSVQENQTNIGTVTATDPNGDALSFSISGGTDQAKFSINSVTGILGFASPPDFENPTDSDLNNVYQVTFTVSDGTHSVQQAVSVTVTDVFEPPTGGTIAITAPVGSADQNSDLQVSISYASGGGGYQTPNWAYRIGSPFPGYGSPHGGTQVTGSTIVNDFLSGQADGSKHVYVALLDASNLLHNPPVTANSLINYAYQTPGGGGGQSPTGGTIAITAPVGSADQNSDLQVSISYASGGGGYQTPNWAYRIGSPFPGYGSPHGGTQVTGSTIVNDFLSGQADGSKHVYVALLDASNLLHNPPVTANSLINYAYQTPGGGGGQSPTGGTIAITAPAGSADQNSDLQVSISYASGGGGYQTPNWAYRIGSPFPGYGSPHGGTQVTGSTIVNDFLSGQADGSKHVYVALLDASNLLHNPPVTDDSWINYAYQSPGGGGGGGGQSPTGGTIAITAPVGSADQNSDLQVSISYASGGGGYQTPNWAYRIGSPFPAYGSPHGGTRVTGSIIVNDFLSGQADGSKNVYVALLDAGNLLHNPPVTANSLINYAYQTPGGGGGGGGQSPTGGTIAITAPVGSADQNSDLQVSISYASGGGGYQTPNWAYRIGSPFPGYGSPHGGTQVTGATSVNDFLSGHADGSKHVYVALLDASNLLHNPPVTANSLINYAYQTPGGGGGGGGGQSPTGGTIAITAPAGSADQNSDLQVSISYASGGGGYQTPNWAYRIGSPFPGYGSPHGGTQVTGSTIVNDFLSGQADGSKHVYVALLDAGNLLHNPPVTANSLINYAYQTPGGGGGGGGQSPTGGTIAITAPVGSADQNSDLQVSISYASGGGGYQTPNWAYRIGSPFPGYGSPHGGTQVTGATSVNDFLSGQADGSKHVYVALLDASNLLHNPPVTADSWINYAYQTPGGGGGGGGQSPTGGTIAITAPVGSADQNSDLQVSISYASGSGGYQTPNWAYRIGSPFPAYGSPHGGTQVTGSTIVNDFLSGQADGSKHVYVALLDASNLLHNPPVTADSWINYAYQTPGGGGGGGGGQSPIGGTIAITAPSGSADQNSDLQVSISYASGGGGYQTPNWAYRIGSPFPGYGSPHGGTQVTGFTIVNDFLSGQADGSKHVYVALLDSSNLLHNPPVTADSWINYAYQSPGGGGGGGQSPTGGTIAITSPVGSADQNSDLQVSISYASGGGGYQTPNWAYRIGSPFPAYGSPHGGTQVTGSTIVNDFLSGQTDGSKHVYVALLDASNLLHNPPVTADSWINYQYQSPGGGGGGGGGGQSPTGGTIAITSPVGNADQHADLQVSISYASGGGGYQTPNWAYRIGSPFPGYGSPHGGTQVTGSTIVNDFLSGQADGSKHVYVALLDASNLLHNPPVTDDSWINYAYQSPGGGGGGGGQSPTGGTIAITAPVGSADQNSDLQVSISYASGGGGYQTPNWAYRIGSPFPAYGSPHGGTRVTGSIIVNDFLSGQADGSKNVYVALLDAGNLLHNPPVTANSLINYAYQTPGGGGGGGGQSPTGGTIAITAPVGSADQNSDLQVSISYASGGGGYQTPNWAYRIGSPFPGYGSPHGGTQVTGSTIVNDFLSGQADGSKHVYVALLDAGNLLHNPPVTADAWINYAYQTPGGGGGGGNQAPFGLGSVSPLTIAENRPTQSLVGILTASDPDSGSILTFTFASGNGAESNQLFTLESNGTLRTMTVLDYEQENTDGNSSLSIRVRVTDQAGAWMEKVFSVTVTDVAEPIPNSPPVISTAMTSFAVTENAPSGTFVGQLNATDADANDSLYFSLVKAGANSPIALDINGSIRTTRTLDFEHQSIHHFFFRTTDNHGAFAEGNLTVRVIDVFQPIAETMEATAITSISADLQGSVIDNGGAPVINRGFLISANPQLAVDINATTTLFAIGQTTNFSTAATNLQSGQKYFYRAFATNAEGTSYGSVESFSTDSQTPKPDWIEATPGRTTDWWSSPWFGNFFLLPNGWAMHQELGWVFPVQSPTQGLWLWKKGMGWLWTADGIYPFMYKASTGNWLYFYGQHRGTRLFYDYGSKKWTTLKEN